jgi:integrase
MALYKRAGIYHYDFTVNGKRYRGTTKMRNEKAATKYESLLMAQAMEKGSVIVRRKFPLLEKFSSQFVDWVDESSLDPDTKRYYNNGWRLLQSTAIAKMRINEITTDSADALKFTGSAATANCAFRTLRRMLWKAKEWKLIHEVPRIKLVEEFGRDRMMEPEEEVKVLAIAPQTLKDVLIAILDSGLRPSEVFAVRWEYVNWNRGTYFNPQGKTRKARRLIYLSDRFRNVLLTRWNKQLEGWVFPSKKSPSGHITTVEKQWLKVRKEAGISSRVVLYCARHTFGTVAMAETGNPAAVRDAMGHEELATTMQYQHQNLEIIREVINRKNRVLFPGEFTSQSRHNGLAAENQGS